MCPQCGIKCGTPLGEHPWKRAPGFPQTSTPCTLPFANFALHLFSVMKLSYEYDHRLGPVSPSSQLPNWSGSESPTRGVREGLLMTGR